MPMAQTLRPARPSMRTIVVVTADAAVAAASLYIAIDLRVGAVRADAMIAAAPWAMPVFAAMAVATWWLFGLHRRSWRYASLTDMFAIAEAATLAVAAFHVSLLLTGAAAWMPRSIPIIQWLVLVMLMGGIRVARRRCAEYMNGSFRPPAPARGTADTRQRALVIGSGDEVEAMLRHLERHPGAGFQPVGVLGDTGIHAQTRIRGVPILGGSCELAQVVDRLDAEGRRPACLLFAGAAERLPGAATVGIIAVAQQLNLKVAYLAGFTEYAERRGAELDFRFVNVADLLGRPQSDLDASVVGDAIVGRCVLVTGAGGTIGRELARQIAGFRPSRLILLDANEFNLYEVDLEMSENYPDVPRVAVLCSIRQRRQLMRVFAEHLPELVFHAAALKHVPLVEKHYAAGVQTNVLGTRNVADAARRYGARAMVQVSTDKAVNPVGFMGMTKRLGELYCQALDLEGVNDPAASRFMTVRFGNVLGSSGSLIPLFQRQLSRGGPLTVTHRDMHRFFMTVQEAVQLVLHSAARGLRDGGGRGRIFVLDMGEPVRIMDIAHRMIRLAGLEPDIDVPINVVGLRPGEKLYEELFDTVEQRLPSPIPGVFEAEPRAIPLGLLAHGFDALDVAAGNGDDARCHALAEQILADRWELPPTEPTVHILPEPMPGALRPALATRVN